MNDEIPKPIYTDSSKKFLPGFELYPGFVDEATENHTSFISDIVQKVVDEENAFLEEIAEQMFLDGKRGIYIEKSTMGHLLGAKLDESVPYGEAHVHYVESGRTYNLGPDPENPDRWTARLG